MHFSFSRKQFILIIFFLFVIPSVFFHFYKSSKSAVNNERYHACLLETMRETSSFSEFTDALFCYEVTSDSVTTAYNLKNPSALKIPALSPKLTAFSYKQYNKEKQEKKDAKLLASLTAKSNTFNVSKLSAEECLTLNLLKRNLSLNQKLSSFAYYDDLLGSTTGVQANLPVTLGEYPLRSEEDVNTYLALLTQVPDYFKNVITYQKHRKSLGFETPDFLLNTTKDNLSTMLSGLRNDTNSFTETFNNRILGIKNLSEKQRKTYQEKNQAYVKKYVLPAYENLYEYICNSFSADAKKTSDNPSENTTNSPKSTEASYSVNKEYLPKDDTPYGLSTLPQGADYYTLLAAQKTGSDRPTEELISMTENSLKQTLGTVLNIALTDKEAYKYYTEHPLTTPYETPEAILTALSLMSRETFPPLKTAPTYQIKTVPKSLAPSLSPAFYMVPAIDDYKNNTIYINPLYISKENGNLFTTLAHEGFPGHLYQTVYFNETNPSPIRHVLDYPGFVEGWATYVEINSFSYLDYPLEGNSLLQLYQSDTLINLALCSRVDLGVNYENWTLTDVNNFFKENGFNNYYTAELYAYVVEAPANYLSYFIGYLEIMDLKEHCKKQLMENYSEIEFHKLLLDIGPSDFTTLRSEVLKRTSTNPH